MLLILFSENPYLRIVLFDYNAAKFFLQIYASVIVPGAVLEQRGHVIAFASIYRSLTSAKCFCV